MYLRIIQLLLWKIDEVWLYVFTARITWLVIIACESTAFVYLFSDAMASSELSCCYCHSGGGKSRWLACRGCMNRAHTSCAHLGGVKEDSLSLINWICEECVPNLLMTKQLVATVSKLREEIIDMKELFQKGFASVGNVVTDVKNIKTEMSAVSELVGERVVAEAACDGGSREESSQLWSHVVGKRKKRENKNLLVIRANSASEKAVDKKKEVSKALSGVQIVETKFTKSGNIIANFKNEQQRNEARDRLKQVNSLKTMNVKKLLPKIMICNVNKDEEKETLIETLIERNEFLQSCDGVKDKISLVISKKAAGGTVHHIVKCEPEVRGMIYKHGDKLKLEWGVYNVRDRYHALLCYHCLRFGHMKSNCPSKDGPPTCYVCASQHEVKHCTNSSQRCSNCVKANKQDIDHGVTDYSCPIFNAELQRIRASTDHGFLI